MEPAQKYAALFPRMLSGAEILARQKAGERNAGGEKTGLNGFLFLRYVWDRFVLHSEHYDQPIDREDQVFPFKWGKFARLYSCAAVMEAPDQPLGVALQTRYMIGSARQLDQLEALTDGTSDAEFRARFAAECVLEDSIALDAVLKSFLGYAGDPNFLARLSVFRKAVRRAAAIFAYYDRLVQRDAEPSSTDDGGSASTSPSGGLTPKQAQRSPRTDPLFSDNSRDSLALLEAEQGRLTAMRQSPVRSDVGFFDASEQLGEQGVRRMLDRYKPYWARMLNKAGTSVTDPEVYDIVEALNQKTGFRTDKDRATWARLQEVLFDEEPRFVLKATRVTLDMADEIAHEIKCGYHLNELNLGYQHVLTPHFMQIVDWWCTSRKNVPKKTLKQLERYNEPNPVWQFTVSEKLSYSIGDNVTGSEGLDGLRVQLFQVLVSLEVAWQANQYVHYDLHAGNVFLKELEPTSRLYDKSLCYKRFNNDREWYCLEAALLRNRVVKILDYGRNRMYVPSADSDAPRQDDGPVLQHNHDTLLFKTGFDEYGITTRPNRCWDARRLLIDVLRKLTRPELVLLDKHPDADAFCALCDAVFHFDRLQEQMRQSEQTGHADEVEFLRDNPFTKYATSTRALLRGRATHSNSNQINSFFNEYMQVVVWSAYDSGATPTSLLDMPFFDALKRAEIADSARNVIVSFPTADLEATKMPAPTASVMPLQQGARQAQGDVPVMMMQGRLLVPCALCGKRARKRSDYQGEQLDWCGPVCYQFHYHHKRQSHVY